MKKRICKVCKEEKLIRLFYKYDNGKRIRHTCIKCSDKQKKKRINNYSDERILKLKISNRNTNLIKRFGISQVDYENLFKKQFAKCAICNQKSNKILHIDHNHLTGKIRQLLCFNCNSGLGMFKENLKTIRSALKYLKFHNTFINE